MRLRTALKICRQHYGLRPWLACRHRYPTHRKALKIGRQHWLDKRFPYIPSDDDLEEQLDIFVGLFTGLAKEIGAELPPELEDVAFDLGFEDLDSHERESNRTR